MKKITEFEEGLLTLSMNRKPKETMFPAFFAEIKDLQIGNGKLLVTKQEWFEHYAPRTKPNSVLKRKLGSNHSLFGRQFSITTYKEGWVISRTQ